MSRTRTYDRAINSRLLYQLSYRGTLTGRRIIKADLLVKQGMTLRAKKRRERTPAEALGDGGCLQ